MKATEMLHSQHREIEKVLEQIQKADAQVDMRPLRDELSSLLVAHTVIEEEHFYPALRQAAPELVDVAVEEHGLADFQLGRLLSMSKGDGMMLRARVEVLADVVLRHIRMEEDELFRRAESCMEAEQQKELGLRMMRRFEDIRTMGYRKFLDRALTMNSPKMSTARAMPKKPSRRPTAKKKPARAATQSAAKRAAAKRAAPARRAVARGTTPKRGERKAHSTRKPAKTTRTSSRAASNGSRSKSAG